MQGELDSNKDQLKTLEDDLKEYKDINKRYRDQLIKVKVKIKFILRMVTRVTLVQLSDMANNDLEKYAKALDRYVSRIFVTYCSHALLVLL